MDKNVFFNKLKKEKKKLLAKFGSIRGLKTPIKHRICCFSNKCQGNRRHFVNHFPTKAHHRNHRLFLT